MTCENLQIPLHTQVGWHMANRTSFIIKLVFFPRRCLGSVTIIKYVIIFKFNNLFCYFLYFLSIKKLKNSCHGVISEKNLKGLRLKTIPQKEVW